MSALAWSAYWRCQTRYLEVQEEAFGDGVPYDNRLSVPALAFTAHAANKAVLVQQFLIQCAGVLAATVGMDDQARARARMERMAMFKALQTSSASMLGAMDHPTTLHANRSSTMARYA